MPPIFKGPIFVNPDLKAGRRNLAALPVARGVIDEGSMIRSWRPTRLNVASGRRTGKTLTSMGVPAIFEEETEQDERN